MPKIAYGDQPPMRAATLRLIYWADEVATDYARRGLGLTVRQLYYQGVAANVFPNKEASYNRLITAVTRGRYAGLIDWNHLTDRGRNAHGTGWNGATFPELSGLIDGLQDYMSHDMWKGQDFRPEVWVEKQALEEVAQRGAANYRVPYIACKGYMSASEMWTAGYHRFARYEQQGQTPVIIHIGDHDPSGIDMTRDIGERASLFAETNVIVERIALNMDQINKYNPPPNPAKTTDSRFGEYARLYGNESWELDALKPELLINLISNKIGEYIDSGEWAQRRAEEAHQRAGVAALAEHYGDELETWLAEWVETNPMDEVDDGED